MTNKLDIFESIQIRNRALLRNALLDEKSLESRDEDGRTPLTVAAMLGYERNLGTDGTFTSFFETKRRR
jgi:hypothetical protein